ncbi:MAG TPA: hypothetical protein VGI81_24740 [Tepidisphaeraceae bacterium]
MAVWARSGARARHIAPHRRPGSGEPDGLLKSYLGADAYARAAAALPAGVTPLTAGDGQLAPYVDRYYQYDGR